MLTDHHLLLACPEGMRKNKIQRNISSTPQKTLSNPPKASMYDICTYAKPLIFPFALVRVPARPFRHGGAEKPGLRAESCVRFGWEGMEKS